MKLIYAILLACSFLFVTGCKPTVETVYVDKIVEVEKEVIKTVTIETIVEKSPFLVEYRFFNAAYIEILDMGGGDSVYATGFTPTGTIGYMNFLGDTLMLSLRGKGSIPCRGEIWVNGVLYKSGIASNSDNTMVISVWNFRDIPVQEGVEQVITTDWL